MDAMQVGSRLLQDADKLTADMVDQIWELIPGYSSPWINREDLVTGVTNVVVGVLQAFIGPDGDIAPEVGRARELGATRALQGVNLEAVIQSFRRMERTLSQAFIALSGGLPVPELQEALRRLSDGFDELSSAAIASYQEIQHSVSAQLGSAGNGFLTGLIAGTMEPEEIVERAHLLELDPDGAYQAFAFHIGGDAPVQRRAQLQRRAFSRLPSTKRGRSLLASVRGYDVFLVSAPIDTVTVEALADSLFHNTGYPVWLSLGAPADGLANAARSAHQAMEAMRIATVAAPPQTVTHFDDVLLDIILLHSDTATSRLVSLTYEPLVPYPHLIETVQAFLAGRLSIKACAEALFLHPNTVAYRLRRIQELTGLDPRDPRALLRMELAVRAHALRDAAGRGARTA